MENYELYHHGVKGMKWGVRKDRIKSSGSRLMKKIKTSASEFSAKRKARRAREEALAEETRLTKTSVKKLTAEELQKRAAILQQRKQALDIERQCKQINNEITEKGKGFVSKMVKESIMPAALDAGKSVLKDYFIKIGKDKLGLNAREVDALADLRRQADEADLRGRIARADRDRATADMARTNADRAAAQGNQSRQNSDQDQNSDSNSDNNSNSTRTQNSDSDSNSTRTQNSNSDSNSTRTQNSNSTSRNNGAERYEPSPDDIIGNGNSRRDTSRRTGPVVDADWRPVNDSSSTEIVRVGDTTRNSNSSSNSNRTNNTRTSTSTTSEAMDRVVRNNETMQERIREGQARIDEVLERLNRSAGNNR